MKKGMVYLILTVLMIFSIVQHADAQSTEADLLIINGKVITVDKNFSVKQAIAVKDGWIVAVGTNEDVQKFAGKKTQVMDLKGKPILPGINESHGHPTAFASVRPPFAIDARYPNVKSLADIKAAVAAKAKEIGGGKWIRGRGWNTALLEEFKNDPKGMPTRKDLDDVAPDNPVILTDWSGHTVWANSKALQLANITRNTPDPDGGKVGKDAAGEPNGMLEEIPAFALVMKAAPLYTIEELKNIVIKGMQEMNLNGVTSAAEPLGPGADQNDFGVRGSKVIEAYRQLYKEGRLTMRVQIPLLYGRYGSVTYNDLTEGSKNYQFPTDVDPFWVRQAGIKIFADGVPLKPIYTAYMWEPYLVPPGNIYGGLVIPGASEQAKYDELIKMVEWGHERGLQVHVHAIGDRAISSFIDGVERASKKNPWAGLRHVIIHGDFITPRDMKRAAQYGMAHGGMPSVHTLLADTFPGYMGEERTANHLPFRSLIDAGVIISMNADAPSTYPDWRAGVQSAVLREAAKSGKVAGPQQRVTREEAIRAYTWGGAWQDHMEAVKGSIEVNKLADFCVITDDILTIDAHKIKDIRVLMTMVAGKVVYKTSEAPF
ncbi:MAG TPA: amidohydrolase [Thermodesulfobacteriota bacterium]|nr:amidohydrolase [Thermodesulfobacteriota bacterium]